MISEKIIENYSNFSNSEKKVANYFLETKNEFVTISQLSKELDVPNTIISRFVKKLDINSFREFKIMLSKEKTPNSNEKFLNEFFLEYEKILYRSNSLINDIEYNVVAKKLLSVRKIHIVGFGSSAFSAMEFKYRLFRAGINADVYNEADILKMLPNIINKNDAVVVLSNTGRSNPFLSFLEQIDCYKVLITSNQNSKLLTRVDNALFTTLTRYTEKYYSMSSSISFLLVIDYLFNNILMENVIAKKTFDLTVNSIKNSDNK